MWIYHLLVLFLYRTQIHTLSRLFGWCTKETQLNIYPPVFLPETRSEMKACLHRERDGANTGKITKAMESP